MNTDNYFKGYQISKKTPSLWQKEEKKEKILAKASEEPYNINELTERFTIGSTKFLDQTATRTFMQSKQQNHQ